MSDSFFGLSRGRTTASEFLLAGSLMFFLAGCVTYRARPIDPATTAGHFGSRSLDDAELRAFIADHSRGVAVGPVATWDLTALTLAAFYFSPDLDVARAQLEVARGAERTAGQRPNPSVEVSPGRNTTTGTPSPWILTSLLNITIETAGKRSARVDRARRLSEVAAYHLASVAWNVRGRVRTALADLFFTREAKVLLEEQVRLRSENAYRIGQRLAAGAESQYEFSRARLAESEAQLAVLDGERDAAEANVRLAAAVGVPPEALTATALSFDELYAEPPDTVLSQARQYALTNRSDLLGALAAYSAAEADLRQEIARQYPDIQLGPGYEYDQGDNKWSLGLGLSLPILNRNRGPIAEAEARRWEASALFEQIQQSVITDVTSAVASYRVARDKSARADTALAQARDQRERADRQRAAGALSIAEVIPVRLEENAADLARLRARSELLQSLGRLEDVLQAPLDWTPRAWEVAPRSILGGDRAQ